MSRRVTHYDIDKCDILLTVRNHVQSLTRQKFYETYRVATKQQRGGLFLM